MKTYALLPLVLALAISAAGDQANQMPRDAGRTEERHGHEKFRQGREAFRPRPEMPKGPRNVSFLVDCSRQNAKRFEFIKKSLAKSIESLQPADIVSIVVYDDSPRLLVPMCEAKDKKSILEKIDSLQPKGDRALFAAISQGADEVRKGKRDGYRNEIIVFGSEEAEIGPSGKDVGNSVRESLKREEIGIFFRAMPQRKMDGFPPKNKIKDKKPRRPPARNDEGKPSPGKENEE